MTEIVLLRDKEWGRIDGEPCRVKVFNPLVKVEDGRVTSFSRVVPYASIEIECRQLPEVATGFITHRTDFLHLSSAFNERGVRSDEEVIVFWTRRHLKIHARLLSTFMPKLWVMVCPRDAFDVMTDPTFKPELTGTARWEAQAPIVEWKPAVMD